MSKRRVVGLMTNYLVGKTILTNVVGVKTSETVTSEQKEVQVLLQKAADDVFSARQSRTNINKIHEITGEPVGSIENSLRLLQDIKMVSEFARLSNNPEYAYTFLKRMVSSQIMVQNPYNKDYRYKQFSRKFIEQFVKKFGIIKPGDLTTRELLEVSDFTVKAFETEVDQIFANWKKNPDALNKDFVSKYVVM